MKSQPKEPLRIIVGTASILFIAFMWAKKDIAAVYASMPAEQLVPMIVTTVTVSLLKIAAIAAVVFLCKWIVGKVADKGKNC